MEQHLAGLREEDARFATLAGFIYASIPSGKGSKPRYKAEQYFPRLAPTEEDFERKLEQANDPEQMLKRAQAFVAAFGGKVIDHGSKRNPNQNPGG